MDIEGGSWPYGVAVILKETRTTNLMNTMKSDLAVESIIEYVQAVCTG
jgi:hypothetical protein